MLGHVTVEGHRTYGVAAPRDGAPLLINDDGPGGTGDRRQGLGARGREP
jgi:hypothetical protein